ncbi:MAG: NYN domain-containing protein [Candidatus Omnitrophica bacterium]|nr:NYN domain-containing protein [Candidatus Omnitrophota bacterium]
MKYILDGYNIIRSSYLKQAERYSSETGQIKLLSFVQGYKRNHPALYFIIVFDGVGNLTDASGIKIIYSGDISADEKIIDIISKNDKKEEYIVVSDDRQIQEGAKIFGCKYIGVQDFMKVADKRKETGSKKMEETDWTQKKTIELSKIEKELKEYYEKESGKF